MEPKYKKVQELTNKGYECYLSSDGTKYWFLNGKRHRLDGPAFIGQYGDKHWYLNGVKVQEEEFKKVQECPLRDLPLYLNTNLAPLVKWRLKKVSTKTIIKLIDK